MLRISKLTDYGTVVLGYLAQARADCASASEVAAATGVGLPTVSKILNCILEILIRFLFTM